MCHRPHCSILVVVVLILVGGCRPVKDIHDRLQGDWLFFNPDAWCHGIEEIDCGYEHVLSVRGDSLRYLPGYPRDGWHRFELRDDTVVVHYERSDYRPAEAALRLIATADDRLQIANDPDFVFPAAWPDTLRYVPARSDCGDSGLTRIALSRGYCTHGPCPDFDVEIARDGRYFYSGHALVDQIGTFRAYDQRELFERINGLLACHPVDSLPPPSMEDGSMAAALVFWFDKYVVQYRGDLLDFHGLHLIVDLLSASPQRSPLEPMEEEREFAARSLLFTGELAGNGGT